ncbi:MAG: type II CAAX endopeptidase family protein, partial [Oscillospiraceae bacterium]
MNQFFNQSPYGKIPLDFDGNFSGGQGELPNHTEKRQLMLLSTVAGLCVVFFLLLQNIIPKIMVKMGIANIYIASEEASICIDIILSLICIFIPFLVASFVVKKISPQTEVLPFRKPNSPELFGIAIAIGVLAMLLSNYITSAFIFYMDNAGVEFSSPSEAQFTGGTASFLLYILRGAIVPALIEEFALRGVIMQPLRKYGDKIAIIISSLIFAVMHGNMVQAPFAFILGCAIGYLVILTESLWTGVAIHFINNAFSIIMAAISTKMG